MPKPGVDFVVPLLERKFPSSGRGQDICSVGDKQTLST